MKNWLWIAAVVVLTLILLSFLLPLVFGWEIPFHSHMYTPMMFPFGGLGMLVFWGAIIYGIYLLTKNNSEKKTSNINLLKQRLSNGDITIEEYEKIKKTLEEE